ncbi:MAG: CoA transferase, partial [Chloroflexota bacterium]|nr:CoA transferase [Chloroflexota bacterium]
MPLEGIRVCDLSWVITGPYCTQIMAEMGAEVIRIESQQRLDNYRDARTWPRGWADNIPGVNRGGTFNSCNLSKKSCTLDLTRPEGLALAQSIAKVSDVVVESFGTGVAERLGLSYATLKEVKPDIIMLRMSATGHRGPWRDYSGFGPTVHALSGMTCLTSYPEYPPSGPGFAYADHVSGLYACLSLLEALEHKRKTGEGQYIDISQTEAMASL